MKLDVVKISFYCNKKYIELFITNNYVRLKDRSEIKHADINVEDSNVLLFVICISIIYDNKFKISNVQYTMKFHHNIHIDKRKRIAPTA